ncbi:MAG: hypothetical protein ACYTHK_18020 [Planctomycetota bacterium]|jgi:hypothetical protein
MGKRIVFIHGRSFKPSRARLWPIWRASARYGIERSRPDALEAFDAATKRFVYFGNFSNEFLWSRGKEYDEDADVADRKAALATLKQWQSHQFTKTNYSKLPGKTSLKEFFADVGAGPLHWFGLSERAIGAVAPDMRQYWNPDSEFGSNVRWPMTQELKKAFDSGDEICVVAHSLGSLISWDSFWKFSYYAEYAAYRGDRVSLFVTIGSPLADETVKDNLKGARASGSRRFPANVTRWENFAAEDDYISHDQKVKNDFRRMLRNGVTRTIRDHRVYNLAVRSSKSNPHSSVGYLLLPKVADCLGEWLVG